MVLLDAAMVLRLGGWDSRYARVLFVAIRDDAAIALIDSKRVMALLAAEGTRPYRHRPNHS